MHVREDGTTVLNASTHGRPLDEMAKKLPDLQYIADLLDRLGIKPTTAKKQAPRAINRAAETGGEYGGDVGGR